MKNRVRNVKMAESKKTALAYFLETVTCSFLIPIDTAMVEPQT